MNNWFDMRSDGTTDRVYGTFTIENGAIDLSDTDIKPGQYYRIIGSVFNDGVYQYPYPPEEEPEIVEEQDSEQGTGEPPLTDDTETPESDEEEEEGLIDEVFEGAVWIMYVPRQVMALLKEIQAWDEKYGPIVETPFNSETFGGYSYYKGYKNTMSTTGSSWKSQFKHKTQKWRKLRNINS